MSKNLDKTFDAYVSTFCMLTKSFHEKLTFFVSCVKKYNLALKMALYETLFCLFTLAPKNVGFSQNLACTHRMLRRKREIFVHCFLYFNMCFPVEGAYAPMSPIEFLRWGNLVRYHWFFYVKIGQTRI
jgi:hypothetical protein